MPRWHPVPPSFAMPLPAEKCGGRDIAAMSREMTLDKASEYNVLLIDTTLYILSAKLAVFIGINKFSRLFFLTIAVFKAEL